MNHDTTRDSARSSRRFNMWPGAIFVFLGVNLCVVGVTIYMAVSDRAFGVEPGYYEKAVEWDQAMAQQSCNAALGWSITVLRDAPLTVSVVGRDGSPITNARIEGLAFHHARSAQRFALTLHEREPDANPGVYTMDDAMLSPHGLWQLRLIATHANHRFTADFVHTVRERGEP